MDSFFLDANLVLAYAAYTLGTASPGPSNLAVMATAMERGRRASLTFALGVVAGSTTWGLLAAFGVSSLLGRYAQALAVIKLLGGLYLLWLAFRSARSAWSPRPLDVDRAVRASGLRLFLRGAAMHLTNPKAILVWLSIVALALPAGAPQGSAWRVVLGSVPIGLTVFGGYALVFSTHRARRLYLRWRRVFDGTLALLFGVAGVPMLASRATG